jgi:hypothetical protein
VQVRVRRRNDAHIRVQSFRRTNAFELAGLDHAQKFRLQVERNVGNLIHEKRAFVRQLESAGAIGLRVGKGAFDVAE